jgi:hypothetical protein
LPLGRAGVVGTSEMAIHDLKLAEALGMKPNRLRRIRTLIKKNIEEIETDGSTLGSAAMIDIGKAATREVTEFWLTEPQELAVCALSRARKAKAVRTLIQVFMAWRRGQEVSVSLPVAASVEQIAEAMMTRSRKLKRMDRRSSVERRL